MRWNCYQIQHIEASFDQLKIIKIDETNLKDFNWTCRGHSKEKTVGIGSLSVLIRKHKTAYKTGDLPVNKNHNNNTYA